MNTQVSTADNENLVKLRELTEKICLSEQEEFFDDYQNKKIIKEIKQTVESEIKNISEKKSEKEKLNCYEKLVSNLNIILNKFNFF